MVVSDHILDLFKKFGFRVRLGRIINLNQRESL